MSAFELPPNASERLRAIHRLVTEWVETDRHPAPGAVLLCGALVLLHSVIEETWLFDRRRWLDPAAVARLRGEHDQFAEDVDLLHTLLTSEPDSPDVPPFAQALFARLAEHLARDARLFYAGTVPHPAEQPAAADE